MIRDIRQKKVNLGWADQPLLPLIDLLRRMRQGQLPLIDLLRVVEHGRVPLIDLLRGVEHGKGTSD